jgi:hypothetical protein
MSRTLHITDFTTKKPPAAKISLVKTLLVALLVSGCAELPLIANAGQAISYAVIGSPDIEINRASVQKLPFASISAKIGSGPRSFLVLGKNENGLKHWFSADGAVIVTRNGRMVQTSGFPENLRNTSSNSPDPVNRKLHNKKHSDRKNYVTYIRYLDMEDRFGVPIKSKFETVGTKEIVIADIKIKTVLIKETNTAFGINWSFTNFYWVDAFDGFVWKSRQHISRNFPPIDVEVLKPAG